MFKLLPLLLIAIFASMANAAECKGHVFFYNLKAHGTEVEADFSLFYHKIIPWFEERNISTSSHYSTPFTSNTCFANDVKILNNNFEQPLGYVLLKPNYHFKIVAGVVTDLDLVNEANEFFY